MTETMPCVVCGIMTTHTAIEYDDIKDCDKTIFICVECKEGCEEQAADERYLRGAR